MAMPHWGPSKATTALVAMPSKNTIHPPHNPYFIKTLVLGLYRNFGTPSSLVFRPHIWIKPWSLGNVIVFFNLKKFMHYLCPNFNKFKTLTINYPLFVLKFY
jgi:hypothetical protein